MANRDYKKIERTIKDFSLNVGEGSGEGNPDGVKVIKFDYTGGGEYYINSAKLKEYIVAKYGEEELSERLYNWDGSGSVSYCMLFSGETGGNPDEYLYANKDITGFELFGFSGESTSNLYVDFFNGLKHGSVTGSSIYTVGNFIDLFSSIHGIGLYDGEPKYYIYNNFTLFIQYYIDRDNYVVRNIAIDLTEEEVREIFDQRK